ncbi:MAG: DUF4388 domain-containing protein [Myxococcales bacterium]|nr:DUF4388 domain-containing protein [Myxococcales bacterium]
MKFLIIAGPYEADLIRRAAVAAACEAITIEAGDSLSGWIAAARPDALVVTSRAVKARISDTVAALRSFPGGNVPIVMLCDEGERDEAAAAADVCFVRPVSPRAVVEAARERVRPGEGAPRASAIVEAAVDPPSSPNPTSEAQARSRILSPEGVSMRSLAPLQVERRRLPSAAPDARPVPAPLSRRICDSIDELLDAEMERAFGEAGSPRASAPRDEHTLEMPRDFVNTLLADARHLLGTAPAFPEALRVTRGRSVFPFTGDLGTTPLAALLGGALQEGVTGRLRVRVGDAEKSLFFEAGRPVLAVSSAVADRMVQMLVRQGMLSLAQARAAIDVATASGRRMGAVLVDLGFIKSTELLPAVRQHYEDIIFSLFDVQEGGFRFEPGVTADPRRVRLLRHPAALVLEGLGRAYGEIGLAHDLGQDGEVWRLEVGLGAPDILLEVSSEDPTLSRVPVLFDGVRSVAAVVRASAQPRKSVLQVALVLRAFGLLVPVRAGEAVTSWDGPGPLQGGEPARDREIDRGRIAARAALVQEGDYYQVLGIAPGASVGEIRQAYDRIAREVSRGQVGEALATELAESLEEICAAIDEALVVLTDTRLRAAYDLHLCPPPTADTRAAG